jgi:hypothetical protein
MEVAEAEFYAAKVYKVTSKTGVVKYKAKGLNISDNTLTDDKFEDEESEERFQAFTAPIRGENLPAPERSGIRSFIADLKRKKNSIPEGTSPADPSVYNLPRQMRHTDTKRKHFDDGRSWPLVWKAS